MNNWISWVVPFKEPYTYTGKKEKTMHSLGWYDYGKRFYDPNYRLSFISIDPLCEKYYSTSPYVYCANNPVRYIDPDGRGWNEALPYLKSSTSVVFSFGLRLGASLDIRGKTIEGMVNMGSIEFGNNIGQKITTGVSVGFMGIGISTYDNAYTSSPTTAVKENGYEMNLGPWREDHKTETTYDTRGQYYEEIKKEEKVETTKEATVGGSVYLIIDIDASVNLSDLWDFVVNLFK